MAHKMAEAGINQDMAFVFFQFSKVPKQIFQGRLQIKAAVYRRTLEESTYWGVLSGGAGGGGISRRHRHFLGALIEIETLDVSQLLAPVLTGASASPSST